MSPEELFLDKERVEDLERAIETELSSFEKQVLDLYLTGMSYTQIAQGAGKRRKVYGQCLTASEEQNPETGVMQNNERREHILEKFSGMCFL